MKSFFAITILALASSVLAVDCSCNRDGVVSFGGQSCLDRGGQPDYNGEFCTNMTSEFSNSDCEEIMANWGEPAGVVFPEGAVGTATCKASAA